MRFTDVTCDAGSREQEARLTCSRGIVLAQFRNTPNVHHINHGRRYRTPGVPGARGHSSWLV